LHEFSELLSRTVATDGNVQHPPSELLRAGVVGAVVQIAKVWIRSGFARRLDAVAADALRICRVLER
jgi:hypothetical protein